MCQCIVSIGCKSTWIFNVFSRCDNYSIILCICNWIEIQTKSRHQLVVYKQYIQFVPVFENAHTKPNKGWKKKSNKFRFKTKLQWLCFYCVRFFVTFSLVFIHSNFFFLVSKMHFKAPNFTITIRMLQEIKVFNLIWNSCQPK